MLKRIILGAGLVLAATGAEAANYGELKCADLAQYPNWSAHVVGWLNLDNPESNGREMNFVRALKNAGSLRRTCENFPGLWLHDAVALTFPQLDSVDFSHDATASIPKRPAHDF
jgi:hypothetical protein